MGVFWMYVGWHVTAFVCVAMSASKRYARRWLVAGILCEAIAIGCFVMFAVENW